MKDAKKMLEEKGISPSLQRVIILKYLQDNQNHPTVETLYQELIDVIPTLSKTTIYNTLKLFGEKGIVYQLAIPGNEAHYDCAECYHAHLLCEKCGEIYDLDLEGEDQQKEEIDGHKVTGIEIIYRGICRKCRDK